MINMQKTEKNSNLIKNILAILFGLALIFSSLYFVNQKEAEEKTEEVVVEESLEEETGTETEEGNIGEIGTEEDVNEEDLSLEQEKMQEIVSCLKEKEVVIYGTTTCPVCTGLVETFGGYNVISPIYVECNSNMEKCQNEMHDTYVPEIQISKEDYKGSRDPLKIAEFVGCEI